MFLEGIPWKEAPSVFEACILLTYLIPAENKPLDRFIVPQMSIENAGDVKDDPSRKDKAEKTLSPSKEAESRRNMQKGLAMELAVAGILRHFDRCPGVLAHAQTKDGRPYLAAGNFQPDITALFPATDKSPEFLILAEVTAQSRVTRNVLKTQIASAVTHAEAELKKHPSRLIYALLINKARVHREWTFYNCFRETLSDHGITEAGGNIRFVPLSTADFVRWLGFRSRTQGANSLHFGAHVLAAALDAVHNIIMSSASDLPDPHKEKKDMWVVNRLQKTIKKLTKKKKKKTKPRRRRRAMSFDLMKANIPEGADLVFTEEAGHTCRVLSAKTVRYNGKTYRLTELTGRLLGSKENQYPPYYWSYRGRKLWDIWGEARRSN